MRFGSVALLLPRCHLESALRPRQRLSSDAGQHARVRALGWAIYAPRCCCLARLSVSDLSAFVATGTAPSFGRCVRDVDPHLNLQVIAVTSRSCKCSRSCLRAQSCDAEQRRIASVASREASSGFQSRDNSRRDDLPPSFAPRAFVPANAPGPPYNGQSDLPDMLQSNLDLVLGSCSVRSSPDSTDEEYQRSPLIRSRSCSSLDRSR